MVDKELLTRNVEDVIVRADLEKELDRGKKLRIKLGIDPTSKRIHIGQAVILWWLREFQDLGHHIALVIGNFTGVIGDSSDKLSERPMLERSLVEANCKKYLEQISRILNPKKLELFYNADWFDKMKLADFFKLTAEFTIQQMIERDNFARRIRASKAVGLHEALYPILQGYDSVMMKTDLEVGGTDQLFNMLAGRAVQKSLGVRPQNIMVFRLLEGLDGSKMSAAKGNCIYIDDEPLQMYGKVMSLRDELIPAYYKLATDMAMEQITQIEKDLAMGDNPRETKAALARRIVARYYDDKTAAVAQQEWDKQFREGARPSELSIYPADKASLKDAVQVISDAFGLSRSETRRKIQQGGVKINDQVLVIDSSKALESGDVIQLGKRHYRKIVAVDTKTKKWKARL